MTKPTSEELNLETIKNIQGFNTIETIINSLPALNLGASINKLLLQTSSKIDITDMCEKRTYFLNDLDKFYNGNDIPDDFIHLLNMFQSIDNELEIIHGENNKFLCIKILYYKNHN